MGSVTCVAVSHINPVRCRAMGLEQRDDLKCVDFSSPLPHLMSQLVLVGMDTGYIAIYDRTSGDFIRVLEGHSQAITDLALCSEGEVLVSTSLDCTVGLWHLRPVGPWAARSFLSFVASPFFPCRQRRLIRLPRTPSRVHSWNGVKSSRALHLFAVALLPFASRLSLGTRRR
jgi:WD40 repeat protein